MDEQQLEQEMKDEGVGGVMRAMAFVLIDRGHDPRKVVDGMIERAGALEAEVWDTMFGPAADWIAYNLGLGKAYPE